MIIQIEFKDHNNVLRVWLIWSHLDVLYEAAND